MNLNKLKLDKKNSITTGNTDKKKGLIFAVVHNNGKVYISTFSKTSLTKPLVLIWSEVDK